MTVDQVQFVAVGSKNSVKVAAMRAVLARIAPLAVAHMVEAASGVPDQPFGDDETIRGARARLVTPSAPKLGFGIEGGVVEMPDGSMRTCAWAAVVRLTAGKASAGRLRCRCPLRSPN
jgi:inosine/xanthosine triphosphatase